MGQAAPGDAGQIIGPPVSAVDRQDHVADGTAQGRGPERGGLAQGSGQHQPVFILSGLLGEKFGKDAYHQLAAHTAAVVKGAYLP